MHRRFPGASGNISQGPEGQISIGFTNSVGLHSFLPALLRSFRETFSAVSIHPEEEGSSSLIDSVINQKNDIVFLRKPAPIGPGLTRSACLG